MTTLYGTYSCQFTRSALAILFKCLAILFKCAVQWIGLSACYIINISSLYGCCFQLCLLYHKFILSNAVAMRSRFFFSIIEQRYDEQHSSGSSGRVREEERKMKSMGPLLIAIFFITYFYRAGRGGMTPRPPSWIRYCQQQN